jgi:hydroxymethylpyrimidine pyrophosphatase-like HAD family hydrolase
MPAGGTKWAGISLRRVAFSERSIKRICEHLSDHQEIYMSADKDRGIRRQKQKRAKELKRQAKQQQKQFGLGHSQATKTAEQKGA